MDRGYSYSGIQGSYGSVSPQFSIQVMDASDPSRIVRTISPPGGIDPNLWAGITQATPAATLANSQEYAAIQPTPTLTRPIPARGLKNSSKASGAIISSSIPNISIPTPSGSSYLHGISASTDLQESMEPTGAVHVKPRPGLFTRV